MKSRERVVKRSVYCVGIALAMLSLNVQAAPPLLPASPFSTTPLHFKSTTSSAGQPNIMLLIDDSDSMIEREKQGKPYIRTSEGLSLVKPIRELKISPKECAQKSNCQCKDYLYPQLAELRNDESGYVIKNVKVPPGRWCMDTNVKGSGEFWQSRVNFGIGERKITAVQNVIRDLLDDPASKKYFWGIKFFNKTTNVDSVPLGKLTGAHKKRINKKLKDLHQENATKNELAGYTPITRAYYNAVLGFNNGQSDSMKGMIDEIKYRCQPNHIIVLSDGMGSNINPLEKDGAKYEKGLSKNKDNYRQYLKFLVRNEIPPTYEDDVAGSEHAKPLPKRESTAVPGLQIPPITFKKWADATCGEEDPVCEYNKKHGMSFLSSQFADMDLKPGGVDAEGGSWNDVAFPKQNVITHTIAFGHDAVTNKRVKNYLKNGADYGGGLFREAKNAAALKQAFKDILTLKAVPFKGYTAVAPAVINTDVAGIAATATLDSANWSSKLRFFQLNNKGEAVRKASGERKTQSAYFPDLSDKEKSHRRVLITHKSATKFFDGADAGISNDDVHIDSKRKGTGGVPAEWEKTFIPWLARYSTLTDSQINDDATANSKTNLTYRVRTASNQDDQRHMGDILGAPVLTMGKRILIGSSGVNKDYKYEYLITAANDGMLHIFKALKSTDAVNKDKKINDETFKPYELKASYIPGDIQRTAADDTILQNLKWQMNPNYGKNGSRASQKRHVFLLNGGVASRTTDDGNNGNRQTFVVVNAGQGGKGSFALNIGGKNRATGIEVGVDANLKELETSLPLWLSTGGNLGYTVSTPALGRVATKWDNSGNNNKAVIKDGVRYAAFIANGHGGTDATSTLYFYDALGQEVGTDKAAQDNVKILLNKKLSVASGGTNPSQKGKGLSSPTPVDIDRDGIVDVVYAGDYTGNMYRFDLRNGLKNWKVTRIYQGSANKPILAAPTVKKIDSGIKKGNYVVMFGTGSDIYDGDLDDYSVQSFYGIYDDLSKEVVENTPTKDQLKVATEADLLQQTLSGDKKETHIRQVTNSAMDYSKHRGWRIDLHTGTPKGERVVTKANVLGNTVFFTSRIYLTEDEQKQKVCAASTSAGYSWLMGVNIDNGGKLTRKNTRFVKDGKPIYYAGIKMSGILSPLSDSFSSQIDKKSYSQDGTDAGYGPGSLKLNNEVGDGFDNKLGKENNNLPRRLICGVQPGASALFFTASDSGFGKIDIQAADCPDPRRISWRELF